MYPRRNESPLTISRLWIESGTGAQPAYEVNEKRVKITKLFVITNHQFEKLYLAGYNAV
jgi:hypothetical protein